jgi:hypothetical protein
MAKLNWPSCCDDAEKLIVAGYKTCPGRVVNEKLAGVTCETCTPTSNTIVVTFPAGPLCKVMLRSFTPLVGTPGISDSIRTCVDAILPCELDLKDDCNIRYLWGFWFQALFLSCAANLTTEYASLIALTRKELARRAYLDKFVAEADYPEYVALKTLFKSPLWK